MKKKNQIKSKHIGLRGFERRGDLRVDAAWDDGVHFIVYGEGDPRKKEKNSYDRRGVSHDDMARVLFNIEVKQDTHVEQTVRQRKPHDSPASTARGRRQNSAPVEITYGFALHFITTESGCSLLFLSKFLVKKTLFFFSFCLIIYVLFIPSTIITGIF